MAVSFLTNLNEEEFKHFLKQSLAELLPQFLKENQKFLPEILDISQAADFLKLKIATLYEKTSKKLIPFFKKGNKLYFKTDELRSWIMDGKVKTAHDMQAEASSYTMLKHKGR